MSETLQPTPPRPEVRPQTLYEKAIERTGVVPWIEREWDASQGKFINPQPRSEGKK